MHPDSSSGSSPATSRDLAVYTARVRGYALPPSPPAYLMGPRDYPGGPTTKPEKVSRYVRFIYPDELLDATTIAPCVSTTERIKRRIRTREGADICTAIRSCLMELIVRDIVLRLLRYNYVYIRSYQ